jgi:Protein of unknown function (DUF3108)
MARWLVPFAVALFLTLATHAVVLWEVGQQLQAMGSVIKPMADPLLTRMLKPQAPAQMLKPPSLPELPKPRATAVPALPQMASTALTDNTRTDSPLAAVTQTVAPAQPTSEPLLGATSIATSLPGQGTDTVLWDWPPDSRLSYRLGGYYRGELHGDAQVQWSRMPGSDGETYQTRVVLNIGFLSAQLTSQGRIGSAALQPLAYEEQLPGGRRRSVTLTNQEAQLDDGRRIAIAAEAVGRVQDTASQFVNLAYSFASGQLALEPGGTVTVWLARPGGLDAWTYDIGPAETIYLPLLGAVQAYQLAPRPLPNARGTISAAMWFAPSLSYLPVRIKIALNDESHLDLLVLKIEQR